MAFDRLKALDERLTSGSGGLDEHVRWWWAYLVPVGVAIAVAAVAVVAGRPGAGLAALGPACFFAFSGGFYYSERLRSLGKTGGRIGPRLPERNDEVLP